ncbi:hypothetical protein BRDCF_p1081 [Bacteroidales bacterium CF]|nr:hypothetical protein BRDCF_p1081 [Bacteroidales bacterium CF]
MLTFVHSNVYKNEKQVTAVFKCRTIISCPIIGYYRYSKIRNVTYSIREKQTKL